MGSASITDLTAARQGVTLLGFDTSPVIYFIESHAVYGPLAEAVFAQVASGAIVGRSSVITLTEVLTHPKRTLDRRLERLYRQMLLNSRHFRLISTNHQIADRAADLCARYNLRTPDAIQLATAIHAGCQAFLTNDLTLRRVTDLRVLTLSTLTL